MIILKGFKYRLYPNKEQVKSLKQQAGNTRFLWNYFLADNQLYYQETGKFKFAHELIVSLPKLKEEFDFLSLSFSQSLQTVGRNFDKALKDSFKKTKGFPVFKCKHKMKDSFTVPQKFRLKKGYVFIPKIGEVKWAKHRALQGKPKHITITQDGEQWFCSVTCEIKVKEKIKKKDKIIGIDLGLKSFAVFSDNTIIDNPKHLKNKTIKLVKESRRLSKKIIGSKNREKQRIKVQKVHRDIRNARNDFQHKLTHDMIIKYDGFIFEDLNIKGMVKNHKLAKSISDVSWGDFKRKIRYKSIENFKYCIDIDRFEPSSKTCNICEYYKKDLELKDREWICPQCGTNHDRDINASINIRKCGLSILKDIEECDNHKTVVKTLEEKNPILIGLYDSKQVSSSNQEKELIQLKY